MRCHKSGDPDWYKRKSRVPLRQPNAISEIEKQRIISVRHKLEAEKFAQIGPSAIKWELRKSGYPLPSDSTINRVLKREGLVKKTSYVPKGVEYPYFTDALGFNDIHQTDFVGPRYIKGDGKFYSFNLMDVYSHRVFIESQRSKADRQVANSLLKCWKIIGMPDYLQLDNQLNFSGSKGYPRSLGLFIRLCLHFEVTPVFIPIAESWRDAYIE